MPYKLIITDNSGNQEIMGDDFDTICIDLDASLDILAQAHMAIYKCINDLVNFIDYEHYTLPIKIELPD